MADQPLPIPPKPYIPQQQPPRPPQPSPLPPLLSPQLPQVAPVAPARPITPPAGIPVKETNMSNITPSPMAHIPSSPKPDNAPLSSAPQSFRASVRTMEQDMKKTQLSSPPRPSSPKIFAPPPVNIPKNGSSGTKMIWFVVGFLIVAMAIVAFFIFRGSGSPEKTPTSTPSNSPTITPLLSNFDEIFHPTDESPEEFILGYGEIKTFRMASNDLPLPVQLDTALDSGYKSVFGKPGGSKGIGYVFKVNDVSTAQSAMTAWEPTMPNDLSSMLNIDVQRASSTAFLGNTYQGTLIRYRNFPDAYSSIDYGFTTLPDGNTYLVLTNTRDHMFGIVDRTLGVVLGK